MQDRNQLEKTLSDALTEGEMKIDDPQDLIRRRLPSKYEIRIQTELDPIVEETNTYRELAREVDDRYDSYMKRANTSNDLGD